MITLRLSSLLPSLFGALLFAQALPQAAQAQSASPVVGFAAGCATEMGYAASGAAIGTPTVIKDGSTACGATARGVGDGALWDPQTLATQITNIDTATSTEIGRQTTIANNDNIANQNAAQAATNASNSLNNTSVVQITNALTQINNYDTATTNYINTTYAVANAANTNATNTYNTTVAVSNAATNINNLAAAATNTSNYASSVAGGSNNTSGYAYNVSAAANGTSNAAQGLNSSGYYLAGVANNTSNTAINTANANNNTTPYLVSVGGAGCDILRFTFSNGTSGTYAVTQGCSNSSH